MENKMYMTKKLADALLDALACLAISAIGGDPFNEETIAKAEKYSRETFCELCDDMEKDLGRTWVVIDEDDGDENEEQN